MAMLSMVRKEGLGRLKGDFVCNWTTCFVDLGSKKVE